MLQFPYLEERLFGSPPPSLPPHATVRWRPLLPIRIIGPAGRSWFFLRALLDTGADDTVFPLDTAARIGAVLQPNTRFGLRWRGQPYSLQFADVELELADNGSQWRWPAVVGFSAAPIRYPILGYAGCLTFFDATFFVNQRIVRLETNPAYPGTTVP